MQELFSSQADDMVQFLHSGRRSNAESLEAQVGNKGWGKESRFIFGFKNLSANNERTRGQCMAFLSGRKTGYGRQIVLQSTD